jgi:hypothetical protein
MLGPGGVSAGDLEARETIPFFGIGLRKTVLVYEGQDKAVYYGAPGIETLRDTLAFTIFLIDSQPDYAQVIIPPETDTEVDQIVRSFQWLAAGTSMAFPTSPPTAAGSLPPDYLMLYKEGGRLKSLPPRPVFDDPEISHIYDVAGENFGMFLKIAGPVPSPNGSYLVLKAPSQAPPPPEPATWRWVRWKS